MKNKPFSKKLLILDYSIAIALIIGYFVCLIINGIYAVHCEAFDYSSSIPQLIAIDGFGIMLNAWIIQLGVSSTAYYFMIRHEHGLQLTCDFIDKLPDNVKDELNMTDVVIAALNSTNT